MWTVLLKKFKMKEKYFNLIHFPVVYGRLNHFVRNKVNKIKKLSLINQPETCAFGMLLCIIPQFFVKLKKQLLK